MVDELVRAWTQLAGRIGGPFTLRVILQPMMATILAVRAGVADARAGRPAYLWAVVSHRGERVELIRRGWRDVGRVFVIACGIDAIYQVLVIHWFYPLQALVVAFFLAIVPYVLVRGPVARLIRRRRSAA